MSLSVWILYELIKFLPAFIQLNPFVNFFLSLIPYADYLSICSMLPLAINRFFRLYFPQLFEIMFTMPRMIIFIIFLDLIMIFYVYANNFFHKNAFIEQALIIIVMLLNTILSICILIKISKMKKLAKESIFQKNILNDLSRAAIVCLIQPICCFIYLGFISVFFVINVKIVSSSEDIPPFLFQIYVFYANFNVVFYELFLIIDTCSMLFVLKTYREGMVFLWNRLLPWKVKKKNERLTIVRTGTVTLTNNFMIE